MTTAQALSRLASVEAKLDDVRVEMARMAAALEALRETVHLSGAKTDALIEALADEGDEDEAPLTTLDGAAFGGERDIGQAL